MKVGHTSSKVLEEDTWFYQMQKEEWERFGEDTPQIFDDHFLEARKECLEENLKDATVISDNHFEYGRKNLKDVEFLVNHKEPKDDSADQNLQGVNRLTKEKKLFNKRHRHCRARVESPFGIIKSKFKILNMKFQEDEKQQDFVVKYAFGFHNASLK